MSNGFKSNDIRVKSEGQTKLVRANGRDNSSYDPGKKKEQRDGNLAGSKTDLSHSLSGTSTSWKQ